MTLTAIEERVRERLANGPVTVAIDGGSASGKTTLAARWEHLFGATVFHMDDFFLQPSQRTAERLAEIGGNVDRERFAAEVLTPLAERKPVTYRRFDCHTGSLSHPITVTPVSLVVVEGAYATHPALGKYYDLSLFLDVDPVLQQRRILARNTAEEAARFFTRWIPLENRYFEGTDIRSRCTFAVPITE